MGHCVSNHRIPPLGPYTKYASTANHSRADLHTTKNSSRVVQRLERVPRSGREHQQTRKQLMESPIELEPKAYKRLELEKNNFSQKLN